MLTLYHDSGPNQLLRMPTSNSPAPEPLCRDPLEQRSLVNAADTHPLS